MSIYKIDFAGKNANLKQVFDTKNLTRVVRDLSLSNIADSPS